MSYINVFEVLNYVKNVLKERDVEYLIESGAPDDEYDTEAEQICSSLFKYWDDFQLETFFSCICHIMKDNFGFEQYTQEKTHVLLDIAYEIWNELSYNDKFYVNMEQENETYEEFEEESEEDTNLQLQLNSVNNDLNKTLQKIEKLKKNLKKTKMKRDNYKNKYDEVLGEIMDQIDLHDQSSVEGVDMSVNGPRNVPLMSSILEYEDTNLQLQLNSINNDLNKALQKIEKFKKKLKKTKMKRDNYKNKYDEVLGEIMDQIEHEDQSSVEGVDMVVNGSDSIPLMSAILEYGDVCSQ